MEGIDGVFYAKAAALLAAGFAAGIGSIGPALGQGFIGMKACENIGKYPENSSKIRTAMFMAMALVETCAIYPSIIAGGLVWAALSL